MAQPSKTVQLLPAAKVRCLAIGDPHFKVSNVPETTELVEKTLAFLSENPCDFVVLLGDILDTHERFHVTPWNNAVNFIERLARVQPTFVLIGNHDFCNNQQFLTDQHAFNALKGKKNITICDKPLIRRFKGCKFVFCPYTPPDRFEEALDTLDDQWDDSNCIFAHQEFHNCKLNPTMTSTDGDIWPEKYPLVVSGHIHDLDQLQDNIYYTGSSLQHGFSESSKKRLALLTFTNDSPVEIKAINLHLTRKITLYKTIPELACLVIPKNTLVKIVVSATLPEFKAFKGTKVYTNLVATGAKITFKETAAGSLLPETDDPENGPNIPEKRSVKEIMTELVEESQSKALANAWKTLVDLAEN